MDNSEARVMVSVGTSIRAIDTALVRFRRSHTNDVVKAYQQIVVHADVVEPHQHAFWVYNLSRGQGVMIVPRTTVEGLRGRIEQGVSVDDSTSDSTPIEAFDPKMHALLCTEPTVVSYLEDNPDNILGKHAQVVTPTFKSALLWWTCE